MIKKLSSRFASVRFIVSRSVDLIEGHWESEKHAVMLGCLCKALLREESATHLQKWRNLKSGQLSKIVSEYDQEIPQSQTADNP